jgi:demethylmenaquinone methyltransferase/2-methoxy-6-polyprenyl-1,4-benzoquinol methylase
MTHEAANFGLRDVDPEDKPALVSGVFDRVAARYDVMNDIMSVGWHRLWKDAAAARLNPQPGELIIDCAGGTGDMASRIERMASSAARRRRGGAPARIFVVDFNASMIEVGRKRVKSGAICWVVGDAQCLPLADGSADAICMAFGLRNVTEVPRALCEIRRVLKSGGRFVCLEFSRPPNLAVRKAYDRYSFDVIPRLGSAVGRNREAYQYLVESIRRFPDQARLRDLMRGAGFQRVSFTNFAGGVCALHQGWAI